MKYDQRDIALTPDGDLAITPGSDIYTVRGISELKQGIRTRIITDLRDLYIHPRFGTLLRDMIGKRNTRELAEEGRKSIVGSLTYGGYIDINDIKIAMIPANPSTIIYHVEITNDTYVRYTFDILCNIENGNVEIN